MIQTIKNAWAVPELRKKILFTIFALLIFRLGAAIPVPYIDSAMLKQQIDHKLDGKLCGKVPIAHKTGENDRLSNDVGIVYGKEPFVICFAGHDTDVYRWEDLMRRSTYELHKAQTENT